LSAKINELNTKSENDESFNPFIEIDENLEEKKFVGVNDDLFKQEIKKLSKK
jgi:hypothetical protein